MAVAVRVVADGPDHRAVGARVGELFAAHGRMVFAVCRAILRDPDEAEDAAQATFLSAHEALVRGGVVREPGAWLATIARNECRGRIQAHRAEPLPLYVEELAGSVTLEDDLHRRTTVAHLRDAIAVLPEKQREAVILRDLYGLRYGEICVALGVSRPSVEALLFRARRTLRVRLRPVGGAAIGVPLAVREGLAQAVPWFNLGQGRAGGLAAAAILGKLAGPVAVKLAVGAVAVGVGVTGSAVVEIDRGAPMPVAAATSVPHSDADHNARGASQPLDGALVNSVASFSGRARRAGTLTSPTATPRRPPVPPEQQAQAVDTGETVGPTTRRTAPQRRATGSAAGRAEAPTDPIRERALVEARLPARSAPTPPRVTTTTAEPAPRNAVDPFVADPTGDASVTAPTSVRQPAVQPEPADSEPPSDTAR